MNNFGDRIKKIRLENGLTMEEFGKKFNTSKGTVNNWEKGRNKPNKENLKAISELGKISIDELFYGLTSKSLEDYTNEELLTELNRRLRTYETIKKFTEAEVVVDEGSIDWGDANVQY